MSKYIIDVDALKECIKLLPKSYDGIHTIVRLDDVFEMIDKFPKDLPINNYTGPIISTSPAVVPDTLLGWEVTCENA